MGETSAISWTDATFNPWVGCTKVSQGCRLCYAETQNNRYQWNPAGWGPGAPRKRTSAANWKKPIEWAKKAKAEGVTRRVFCASLADVFDPEVSQDWRSDLWYLINLTGEYGGLEWLLLTKRPQYLAQMLPAEWIDNPPDYVRLGVTAEDQENYDRRWSKLARVWHGKNFVSYEPALGELDLGLPFVSDNPLMTNVFPQWVICGGESGAGCRAMNPEWAEYVHVQCANAGIPFFFKQMGGYPDKRHDPSQWPPNLRVQEFPI